MIYSICCQLYKKYTRKKNINIMLEVSPLLVRDYE